jgi:hypothetical protein
VKSARWVKLKGWDTSKKESAEVRNRKKKICAPSLMGPFLLHSIPLTKREKIKTGGKYGQERRGRGRGRGRHSPLLNLV